MFSYKPFYETLHKRNMTEYQLIYKYGFPANILHRMKNGKNITLKTLDTLCDILDCELEDLVTRKKD